MKMRPSVQPTATGTISPADARKRFRANRHDPLFLHDGSDDGQGNGASRMLSDATVLVPDLESQALSAIQGHAQAGRLPTDREIVASSIFSRQSCDRSPN